MLVSEYKPSFMSEKFKRWETWAMFNTRIPPCYDQNRCGERTLSVSSLKVHMEVYNVVLN